MKPISIVTFAFVLAACGGPTQPASSAAQTAPTAPAPKFALKSWEGRWVAPEGLFADINGAADGGYQVTMRYTLDDEAVFTAREVGDTLQFTRDGVELTARQGKGDDTGFKYLAGKQDCLIVVADKEGYCRD
jgi:hypothetical protein